MCQTCIASYVTARVEENRVFGIFCPFEGCKNELYEQDIQRLVQASALKSEVSIQLAKLRKQDYTSRLSEACESLGSMGEQSQLRSMRLCPRCSVIIQKSSGCNSFGCICGHKFRYDEAPSMEDINAMLSNCVKEVTRKHNMSASDAVRRVVAACGIKGIRKYARVLKHAEQREISLDAAEVHEQALLGQAAALSQLEEARRSRHDAKVSDLLVAKLSLSPDEANEVVQKAKAGDQVAWGMIRRARQARSSGPVQPSNSTEPIL